MRSKLAMIGLVVLSGLGLCAAQNTVPGTATMPLYSFSLPQQRPDAAVAAAGQPDWARQLAADVAGIRQDLNRLLRMAESEGGPPPAPGEPPLASPGQAPPPSPSGPPPALVAASQVCARCHAPQLATEKGGYYAFFRLTADQKQIEMLPPKDLATWTRQKRRVLKREMPPRDGPPDNPDHVRALTDEELREFDRWMDANRPPA